MSGLSSPFLHLTFSQENLFDALSNSYCTPKEASSSEQVNYLYRYLEHLEAKVIIVENGYIDGDYLDDYSSYYSRCFSNYSRQCKRLHFFSHVFEDKDFFQIITNQANEEEKRKFRDKYLGFVVARPLPEAIIGRTILKTYEPEGGRRNYPCTKKYEANLFGTKLIIKSLPYQEQDKVLAACATVSLWSCFHKTSELFGTPCPRPASITRVANQVVRPPRPFPSSGLSVEQICHSIRSLELEPEVINASESFPLVSLLYGYLRMELPVILIVDIENTGLHAITITGYSINKERMIEQETPSPLDSIPMIGLRINEFYAHDDQIGPFSRLWVKPSAPNPRRKSRTYPVTFEGSWKNSQKGKNLTIYPEFVIVPLYHKIRLTFMDVTKWLYRFTPILEMTTIDIKNLEWDIHLITNNCYKENIKNSSSYSEEKLKILLTQQNPRFFWRASLSLEGKEILELLVDATDMNRSFSIFQLEVFDSEFRGEVNKLLNIPELGDIWPQILTEPFLKFLKKKFCD